MAIMYPSDLENYNYTQSEKAMYIALHEQLPDKYHVFYSVRWFDCIDGVRVDSESDFIVFDPTFGFITIEVKGGQTILQDGDEWSLIETVDGETSTRVLKCSPYVQAEKSMRHFHSHFREEFHQSFNGAYGFAVAFPWYAADSIISSSNPKEVTIDMNDMNRLHTKINQIFHYWKNKRNLSIPFSPEQRQRFISMINKRISLSAAAGALIPIREKELQKINCVQDSILDAVYNYRELKFVGGAGTGKTFIGAKKAIRDIESGKRVLFTCCSKRLIQYVKSSIFKSHPTIECLSFSDLMQRVLGENYATALSNGTGFFDYIEKLPESAKFDSIIIDEAQDYDVDMGLSMRALLSRNFSTFYVFFDENQNVFSKDFENSFSISYPPIILRYNIRNTGCIYENATQKTGLGRETVANSLVGVNPEYFHYTNKTQCLKSLTNIVNHLLSKEFVSPDSIVLLANKPFNENILSSEDSIGSIQIDKSENSVIIDNWKLRCFTISSFKGLEADVVILLNQVSKGEKPTKESLCQQYVALTRARYYLYVIDVII